jgi:RND family efflux transporter MFP subunit
MKTPKIRPRAWAWTLAAAALLAAGTAATLAMRGPDDQRAPKASSPASASKAALTVTLIQPQRANLATAVWANGNIAAWQEAIVGAEGNGGRLSEVRVNVGDRVQRGQVLATLGAGLAQAELAQSRAAVAEAEATLAEAGIHAQRARDLQSTGAWSTQQINQILTAERTAQARLEAVGAAATVQQLRLAQMQVLAPDSGVISARAATVGAVVPAGMELFRLIRGGRLEWRAEVAAGELAQITPGLPVRVTPAGGATVTGTVRSVAPTVDAATRNGLVYVDLPVPGMARAGMFARGEFEIGSSSAATLPQTAVLLRDGYAYVFRLGPDSTVVRSKVSVGRRVGERIEITAGLDPAARVVATGAGFLADGDTVRVVPAAPAPTPAPASGSPR